MKTLLSVALLFQLSILVACSHAPLSKTFNEANSKNITAQTVNQNAVNEEASLATMDGQKSEQLLDRYRTDTGKAASETLVKKVGQ